MTRWLDGITDSMDMSLSKLGEEQGSEEQGSLECCSSWGQKEAYETEQLNTITIINLLS